MRTLYNDDSKGSDISRQMRGVEGIGYAGLTQANNNSGDLSPSGLLFALGDMGADVAEVIPTMLQNTGLTLKNALKVPTWADDWITGFPQYNFDVDLNGLRWDDIFNPHPTLGLKTSSIARVFWVMLAIIKGSPMLGKGGISLINKINGIRRSRKTRHFRADVRDALDELLGQVNPVGHDTRVAEIPDMDELLTQLASALYSNNTGTKKDLGRLLSQQNSDV